MANGRIKTASFGPGFLGAILLFCGFAMVAWILFRFAAPTPTYEEKRAKAREDKVAAINAEAKAKLYSPAAWIDKAKGTVQLPIDTAMDLVINDYQKKPVQASQVKVEIPYPAGLQMAAPAAPAVSSTGGKPIGKLGSPTIQPPPVPASSSALPAASPSPEVKK